MTGPSRNVGRAGRLVAMAALLWAGSVTASEASVISVAANTDFASAPATISFGNDAASYTFSALSQPGVRPMRLRRQAPAS
ncbi:MAG TPA: hypothetical protein VM689_23155 [Aliidongia sp.]|nr:hypothetical protein [Aliidongia sp.]